MHIISYQINTWKVQNCIIELQESGCRNLDAFQCHPLFFCSFTPQPERWKMGPSFRVSQSPYLETPCLCDNPYTLIKVAFCLTYAIYIYIYLEKAQRVPWRVLYNFWDIETDSTVKLYTGSGLAVWAFTSLAIFDSVYALIWLRLHCCLSMRSPPEVLTMATALVGW